MTRPPGRFHIGEIITTATGTFMCPTGMQGVYDLIEHITGEQHQGHQLGRASDDILDELCRQLPWLAGLTIPPFTGKTAGMAILDQLAAEHGEYHHIEPLPFGAYVGRDPLPEAAALNPLFGAVQPDTARQALGMFDQQVRRMGRGD